MVQHRRTIRVIVEIGSFSVLDMNRDGATVPVRGATNPVISFSVLDMNRDGATHLNVFQLLHFELFQCS